MDTTCVLSANHLLLLDRAIPIYSTASWALALRDLLHLCFFLCLFSCLSLHSSFCLHHFPVSLSLFAGFPPFSPTILYSPFAHLLFLAMTPLSHTSQFACCFSCIFPSPPFLYNFPRSLFPLFQLPSSPSSVGSCLPMLWRDGGYNTVDSCDFC